MEEDVIYEAPKFPADAFLETAVTYKATTPAGKISYLDFEELAPKNDQDESFRSIKLGFKEVEYMVATFSVSAKIDGEGTYTELKKIFDSDAEALVKSALNKESLRGIKKTLYLKYQELGEKNSDSSLSGINKELRRFFNIKNSLVLKGSQRSLKKDAEKLIAEINFRSNRILNRTRKHGAEFIIVDSITNTILENSTSYEYTSFSSINTESGIYLAGRIGNILVFLNQDMPWGCVIMGSKTRESQTGVAIVDYKRTIKEIYPLIGKKTLVLDSRMSIVPVGEPYMYETFYWKFSRDRSIIEKIVFPLVKERRI